MLRGIDVSSYQPPTPDLSGLDFLFVKVTQGLSYENPEWVSQRQDARDHGLVVGFYHYPEIANSAAAEADFFLSKINLVAGDILCLDWEWYGQSVTDAEARAYKDAWIARVRQKAPGHRIVVYADRNNWVNVDTDSNAGDGLWIADYVTAGQPRVQAPWVFHQFTSSPQDEDVANPRFATREDLKVWAGSATPAPPPPPPAPTPSEEDVPSFVVTPTGLSGVTFARGSARTVSFFTDNTLLGGPTDKGAILRVVVWATGKAPEIHEAVAVSNKGSAQVTIDFSDPSLTHSVTVTRVDKAPYPVFGEVS
ncbi:GH25 family lysozyme [Streptomyces sp. NPDC093261]|uniref:GH25 family lysozyme n=1 Tax=Streptomyces sp. NPDC093261 TaxID=3366037 RepID=UPI003822AAF1